MNDETAEETTEDRTEESATEQESSEERPRRRKTTSSQSSSGTASRTATKPKQTRTRPTAAKSSTGRTESDDRDETEQSRPTRAAGAKISAVKAVKQALEQFNTVSGRAPESVVGTRWNEDHWVVRLEVVESRRIPDTADLLAEYEVELDGSGELLSYSRMDRYVRGRPSE